MIVKDPVYGYINIEDEIKSIIDTANFQRLRDIVQTNYYPLFPSSIHNRFAHSLGVYYLGKKAIKSLCKNFTQKYSHSQVGECSIDEIKRIFLLACLLHDIGHSPFSHTGEDFYLDQKSSNADDSNPKLIDDLATYLDDPEYFEDTKKQPQSKAHEYMSAYLGVKNFLDLEDKPLKVFFVRCIIGVPYYNCPNLKTQFMNACISLLNSSTIDVDKLDYLIRDSYMTGYNTVSIDYERLLKGISFNELPSEQNQILTTKSVRGNIVTSKHIFVAFKKGAISVLENVILANDLERKWLQSHPVVMYGSYLLQVIISRLNSKIENRDDEENVENRYLFSYDSLIDTGTDIGHSHIRYLSDSDILYLAKNIYYDEWSEEYFNRNLWRHPLWKSEAEFKILIEEKANTDILLDTFIEIEEDLRKYKYDQSSINSALLKAYTDEFEEGNNPSLSQSVSAQKSADAIRKKLNRKIQLLQLINNYCTTNQITFDFVVKTTKQFTSGMTKDEFKKIPIQFDEFECSRELQQVSPLLDAESDENHFFYIYHNALSTENEINVERFCEELATFSVRQRR